MNDTSSCFSGIEYKSHHFTGIGYDSSRSDDSRYKIFTSHQNVDATVKVWITELGSNTWKFHEFVSPNWCFSSEHSVSLNGTLYWVARYLGNYESPFFIQSFDFSTETFKPFCILPDNSISSYDLRSLEVFRRDRLSYLHRCSKTNNIDIWLTKRKIENEDGEAAVEWIKFMNVSVPYSSCFKYIYNQKSYFIDDKSLSLVLCCWDHNKRQAYIYIAKGDEIKEIKLEDVVEYHRWHRTYCPSFVQVPS